MEGRDMPMEPECAVARPPDAEARANAHPVSRAEVAASAAAAWLRQAQLARERALHLWLHRATQRRRRRLAPAVLTSRVLAERGDHELPAESERLHGVSCFGAERRLDRGGCCDAKMP
jgi:hypothetical protein